MFNRSIEKRAIALAALMLLGATGSAMAYSCEVEYKKAESLILLCHSADGFNRAAFCFR